MGEVVRGHFFLFCFYFFWFLIFVTADVQVLGRSGNKPVKQGINLHCSNEYINYLMFICCKYIHQLVHLDYTGSSVPPG